MQRGDREFARGVHNRGNMHATRGHSASRGTYHGPRRGHGPAHGQHNDTRVDRRYQAKIIIVQLGVDAGDVKVQKGAIPEYTVQFTPDEESLNAAKDALGSIGSEETAGKTREYLQFRNVIDMYSYLRREILRIGGEKNASNAFLKYYELAYSFLNPLLASDSRAQPVLASDTSRRTITSFFNAELPGSSMVAFNHFMRTIHPEIDYKWYASSLWTSELVEGSYGLEDKYGYVKHNPNNWLMTPTNNGDMTSIDNILDIAARIGPRSAIGGVDIYSHDAGIDVSGAESGEVRFDIQEDANMWLHLGCAIAGFLTLKTGPQTLYIAKQYTLYRTFTWNLMLIYADMFDRLYLTKPLTSRPTNSEIYIVGVGFRGARQEVIDLLIERLKTRNSAPLLTEKSVKALPALSAIQRFVSIVYGQQRDMLLEIAGLHGKYTTDQITRGTYALRTQLINNWLHKHPVKRISPADRVPSN